MNEQNELQDTSVVSLGLGEKLINILTSPSAVFAQIRERLTWQDWVVPFLLAVLFAGIAGIVNAPENLQFTRKMMEPQKERILQSEMSDDQQQKTLARIESQEEQFQAPKKYYWSFLRSLAGIGISILILAGLYYFSGNTILGGQTEFPKILAVVSLPQMVKVVETLYSMLFVQFTGSAEVPQSLAVMLPYSAVDMFTLERYQQAMLTLLSQIDVFTIWRLVLFTIGFSIIYKVSKGKATAIVFGWWVFWLLVTTAGSFLFAGLSA